MIGKAIVSRWEVGGGMETGDESQDEEGRRSRVRRKEAGEKKLRRRRRRNGEGENVMKTKRYDVRLDEDVTSDAHLLGGGGRIGVRKDKRKYRKKERKTEISHNERDIKDIAKEDEEGEAGRGESEKN